MEQNIPQILKKYAISIFNQTEIEQQLTEIKADNNSLNHEFQPYCYCTSFSKKYYYILGNIAFNKFRLERKDFNSDILLNAWIFNYEKVKLYFFLNHSDTEIYLANIMHNGKYVLRKYKLPQMTPILEYFFNEFISDVKFQENDKLAIIRTEKNTFLLNTENGEIINSISVNNRTYATIPYPYEITTEDNLLRVFDLEKNTIIHSTEFESSKIIIRSISVTADNKKLLIVNDFQVNNASPTKSSITVYDIETQIKQTLFENTPDTIKAVFTSKEIIVCIDKEIFALDINSFEQIRKGTTQIRNSQIDPLPTDEKIIVFFYITGMYEVFSLENFCSLKTHLLKIPSIRTLYKGYNDFNINGIAENFFFGIDLKTGIVDYLYKSIRYEEGADIAYITDNNRITLFELPRKRVLKEFSEEINYLSVTLSPNKKLIDTCNLNTLEVYTVGGKLELISKISNLNYKHSWPTPDETKMIIVSELNYRTYKLKLLDFKNDTVTDLTIPIFAKELNYIFIGVSNQGYFLCLYDDSNTKFTIHHIDFYSSEIISSFYSTTKVNNCRQYLNEDLCVTGHSNGQLIFRELATGNALIDYQIPSGESILNLEFTSDKKFVLIKCSKMCFALNLQSKNMMIIGENDEIEINYIKDDAACFFKKSGLVIGCYSLKYQHSLNNIPRESKSLIRITYHFNNLIYVGTENGTIEVQDFTGKIIKVYTLDFKNSIKRLLVKSSKLYVFTPSDIYAFNIETNVQTNIHLNFVSIPGIRHWAMDNKYIYCMGKINNIFDSDTIRRYNIEKQCFDKSYFTAKTINNLNYHKESNTITGLRNYNSDTSEYFELNLDTQSCRIISLKRTWNLYVFDSLKYLISDRLLYKLETNECIPLPALGYSFCFLEKHHLLVNYENGKLQFMRFRYNNEFEFIAELTLLYNSYIWQTAPDEIAPQGWIFCHDSDKIRIISTNPDGTNMEVLDSENEERKRYLLAYNRWDMIYNKLFNELEYQKNIQAIAGNKATYVLENKTIRLAIAG